MTDSRVKQVSKPYLYDATRLGSLTLNTIFVPNADDGVNILLSFLGTSVDLPISHVAMSCSCVCLYVWDNREHRSNLGENVKSVVYRF